MAPNAASGAEPSHGIPVAIDPACDDPAPPPRSGPTAIPPPRAVPSASVAPRERRLTAPDTIPADITMPSEPVLENRDTLLDFASTQPNPPYRPDDLGLAADTMPAMPAMPALDPAQPSVSTVRFRPSSSPPANTTMSAAAVPPPPNATMPTPALAPPIATPDPAAASSLVADLPAPARPAPPAPAPSPSPTPPHAVMTSTRRQRLITPATALFAEPEPDAPPATAVTTSLHGLPDTSPASRRRVTLGRVLLVVLCLALVSAATTAAGLYLTREQETARETQPAPPPPPARTLGTVDFAVAPADATIAITGKPITRQEHDGSPWTTELPPGGYQIEIDRKGYQGWLTSIDVVAGQSQTLQVSLEALGAAVITEATLVVGPSPGGLDITVDGVAFGKTPGRLSITAGHHVIALRSDDAEVWRKEIDVRASAVYEIHPAIPAPATHPATGPAAGAAPPGAPATPPANAADPAAAPTSPTDPGPAGEPGAPSAPPAAPPTAPVTPEAAPASPGNPPSTAPRAAGPITVPASAVQ
jgi:hypothetical protein